MDKSPLHPLVSHLHTQTGWEIIETQPPTGEEWDHIFMTANGYMGYRGTRFDQRADDHVSCVVSDTFENTTQSLCNVPNGLFLEIRANGKRLSPLFVEFFVLPTFPSRHDKRGVVRI